MSFASVRTAVLFQNVALLVLLGVAAGCGDGEHSDDFDSAYDDSCDASLPSYTLEISLGSVPRPGRRLGALQLDVTHLGRSGCFTGRGDLVDCEALIDALVASNYPGGRTLKTGLISLQGIMPGPIMRCGFQTAESLSAASFVVNVADASTPDGEPVDPPPTVGVTVARR